MSTHVVASKNVCTKLYHYVYDWVCVVCNTPSKKAICSYRNQSLKKAMNTRFRGPVAPREKNFVPSFVQEHAVSSTRSSSVLDMQRWACLTLILSVCNGQKYDQSQPTFTVQSAAMPSTNLQAPWNNYLRSPLSWSYPMTRSQRMAATRKMQTLLEANT